MTRHRWLLVAGLLALVLAVAVVVALRTGVAASTAEVVWRIRAPRVAMALLVGAGLALAGVLMQGSLGNPLADPGLVGVSAGAALGAVIAVTVGASFNTVLTAAISCVGAAIATAIVVAVSMRERRPEVVTLLLAGVAVTAFAIAALALMASMSTNAAVRSITFWSSGSLALSTWSGVVAVAPFVVVGVVLAGTVASSLDVMSLGDRAAMATGVNVARVRYLSLTAVVLLVAAGVAVVGVIAFVGLLVPHAVRMMAGPRHAPATRPECAGRCAVHRRRGHAGAGGRQPAGDPHRCHHRGRRGARVLPPHPTHARTAGRLGMSAVLELRAASRVSGDRVRLHPTSLLIESGTVTGVIGRNGSGKSTMLQLMSSELAPSHGTVLIDGDDATGLSLVERARRRAILGQETTIAFPFTAREVVAWGRTPWRGTEQASDDDAVVADAIAAQGLADLADRPVTELSGGERKRVHLARVVAQRSPLLLLDEADSDLDLVGRRVLDDLVAAHARSGRTAIVVSHDVNRLARVCDRFIVMRGGHVHAEGTAVEVLTAPTLSAAFDAPVMVDGSGDALRVHLP